MMHYAKLAILINIGFYMMLKKLAYNAHLNKATASQINAPMIVLDKRLFANKDSAWMDISQTLQAAAHHAKLISAKLARVEQHVLLAMINII